MPRTAAASDDGNLLQQLGFAQGVASPKVNVTAACSIRSPIADPPFHG
jgi:hypothetical protein